MQFGLLAVIRIRTVHFKTVFSSRSGHIVKIGSNSIVGMVAYVRYPRKISPSPVEIGDKIVQMWTIGRDSYPHSPLQGECFSKIKPYC